VAVEAVVAGEPVLRRGRAMDVEIDVVDPAGVPAQIDAQADAGDVDDEAATEGLAVAGDDGDGHDIVALLLGLERQLRGLGSAQLEAARLAVLGEQLLARAAADRPGPELGVAAE